MEKEKKSTRKPAAKKPVRKTKSLPKTQENIVEAVSVETLTVSETPVVKNSGPKINTFSLIFVLMVVILGLLGYLFRDRIFAATVNGKPIFRYELNERMVKTFGKEVLENLIVERLVAEEAAKNSIAVTSDEVDEEVKKVSESLGPDTKLEDILKFQGMTLEDFKEQMRLKIQVNKLLANEVVISDEEIADFVENNSQSLTAADDEGKKEEARNILKEQKINQAFGTWIDELMKNSKITRYLN
ncbi:hypothetical protein C4578_01115 [Candidatus Microgenomates bacterium]|jgi:hypothetical protein|nr:MAG: hypothetical protein C4578_01115 [Candidatus Microgenomates bacterium]